MNKNKSLTTVFTQQKNPLLSTIIVLFTIACLFTFCIKLSSIRKDTPDAVYGIDFIAYYTAAQLIESGDITDIYAEIENDFSVVNSGKFFETAREAGFHLTPTRYVYLPIFLAPFTLFTTVNYPTAANLWLMVNLCALIAVIILEWSLTSGLPHPWLRLMSIISLNLCSFPLLYALKLGQTSIMVYLIVCLIYYFTVKKQDHLAGIFLGFITALKYSPFLFILYFLYRRRYSLVISSTLTIVSLLLLSLFIYGLPLHKIYWSYLTEISAMGIAAWSNQSIDAFVLRLATKTNIFHFYPVKATTLISIIGYSLTFSAMGIVYLFLRSNKDTESSSLYPLEFSSIILCCLLIPTISWLHYFTVSVLSIVLIISFCWRYCSGPLKLVVSLIAISYTMIAFHPDYAFLTTSFGQGAFTRAVVSFPFFGTFTLLLINLILMKKARNPI